ncbi:MAG: pantetheine-phosphate adenylyltransferase [Roseburia sp.]|nr:pantetheine-phosphate adenylyltransferase [Roseburia sp.]
MYSSVNTIWVLFGTALVFFMQAGFSLCEAGFTRAKNTGNILMKNLMDFCIGTPAFWLVGFGLMFGKGSGIIGSFDPLTLGHIDIIKRASGIVDELVVGVLNNSAKNSLFSLDERVSMIEEMTKDLPNVSVTSFDGLLVEHMKQIGATIIVRGLRAVTDFEYELQIAQTNHVESPEVETIFLTASLQYSYLSSTIVKEFASYGGDISKFVPAQFIDRIYAKYNISK